jgi:hypothetical protein
MFELFQEFSGVNMITVIVVPKWPVQVDDSEDIFNNNNNKGRFLGNLAKHMNRSYWHKTQNNITINKVCCLYGVY